MVLPEDVKQVTILMPSLTFSLCVPGQKKKNSSFSMSWTWQNLGKWKCFNHLVSLNLERSIYSFIYFWNSARKDEVSTSARQVIMKLSIKNLVLGESRTHIISILNPMMKYKSRSIMRQLGREIEHVRIVLICSYSVSFWLNIHCRKQLDSHDLLPGFKQMHGTWLD